MKNRIKIKQFVIKLIKSTVRNLHIGHHLMGLPVGIRFVSDFLIRWGPYRWGAWLENWSQE